ncbi:MAG: GNAT family N-acetyltransferase [Clostridia bacterium]|nr:GNAT family N-acetyltransferase [Clostridia bacterium]
MTTFVNINDAEMLHALMDRCGVSCDEYLDELVENFTDLATEVPEVALSFVGGCALVRIYDEDRYLFIFPIALSDSADVAVALDALAEYIRREMLTFVMSDVPRDGLEIISSMFSHVDAMAYEDDEDLFAVAVKNELDMLDEYPTVTVGDVTLSPLTDADTAAYSALCSDRELNRYWGYDDLADNPTADPEIFMLTAEREKRECIALSLAIRRDGCYLGEAVIYDFDFREGAEVGIRLLPQYHGGGVGILALDGLIKYAREIGLTTLRARVRAENTAAIRMTKKRMLEVKSEDGVVHFFAPVTGFELED